VPLCLCGKYLYSLTHIIIFIEVNMQDIYIYTTVEDWNDDKPEGVLKGTVEEVHENYIKIRDENNLTQIIVLSKLFAVVY
jgi:hypothetical protein